MIRADGLYVVKSGKGGFVNLVVGSKTFRLAEFHYFEKAVSFAFSISERNPETLVFISE